MIHRKDIDGLRAFAVVPVILNHAKLPFVGGGFVGVDIFFVISGFLISGIIIDDISNDRFSLLRFYERRARRIIPALVIMIFSCIFISYFTMLPEDFDNFAQSVVATVLFSNNILLTLTSGYWELNSDFKPLLHTWSLGVEEQFYLFYPILVFAIIRFNRAFLGPFLVFCIACSIVASVVLTPLQPNASFYLIHTRAWELFGGAFCALYYRDANVDRRLSSALSWVGLSMILGSILFINEGLYYPYFYVLFPGVGTALILSFSQEGSFVNRLLSMRLFTVIGIISYSAYLWHQPIFAFARVMSVAPPNSLVMTFLIVLTFGVAYISWRYIEEPFRDREKFSPHGIFLTTAVSCGMLLVAGLYIYGTAGLPQRVPGIGLSKGRYIAYNERVFSLKKNKFETTDKPRLLILGNSTGRDLVNVALEDSRFSMAETIYRDDLNVCKDNISSQPYAQLLRETDIILIAANFEFDESCKKIDLSDMALKDSVVLVVGPKHFGYNLNAYIRLPVDKRSKVRATLLSGTISANRRYAKLVPRAHYVNVIEMMKLRFGGTPVFNRSGQILSGDRVHLTEAGAAFFAAFIFEDPAWLPVFQVLNDGCRKADLVRCHRAASVPSKCRADGQCRPALNR